MFNFRSLFQAYSTFTLVTTVGYIYIDNNKTQDNMQDMYHSYIEHYNEE